jgi:hypothetical protein
MNKFKDKLLSTSNLMFLSGFICGIILKSDGIEGGSTLFAIYAILMAIVMLISYIYEKLTKK